MNFYKEIVITKKILIPFSEARNNIVWGMNERKPKFIINLVDEHICNIINMLLTFKTHQFNYSNLSFYTYKEWITIFKLELEFRTEIRKQTSLSSIK